MEVPALYDCLQEGSIDRPDREAKAIQLVAALARILGGIYDKEVPRVWRSRVQAAWAAARAPAGPLDDQQEQSSVEHKRKPDPSTDPCAFCGAQPSPGSKHKLCGGCKAVLYCSKECQAKHWKEGGHKSECSRVNL